MSIKKRGRQSHISIPVLAASSEQVLGVEMFAAEAKFQVLICRESLKVLS